MTPSGLIDALPAILKFGVTGLSAIVFILAYQLMKQVIAKTRPAATKAQIGLTRSFMWISLTFCLLSAVATAFQQSWDIKARDTSHSLELLQAHMAQRAREAINARYTGQRGKDALVGAAIPSSPMPNSPVPDVGPNIQEITVSPNQPQVEHINSEEQLGGQPVILDTSPLPSNYSRPVVMDRGTFGNQLSGAETELTPENTGLTQEELNYRKLRRAVFESFYDFNADKDVLTSALKLLLKNYTELGTANSRVLEDFAALRSLRLRWLQDNAIPKLESAQAAQGVLQQSPLATVDLPEEIHVSNSANQTCTVTNLELLKSELALLKTQ